MRTIITFFLIALAGHLVLKSIQTADSYQMKQYEKMCRTYPSYCEK